MVLPSNRTKKLTPGILFLIKDQTIPLEITHPQI